MSLDHPLERRRWLPVPPPSTPATELVLAFMEVQLAALSPKKRIATLRAMNQLFIKRCGPDAVINIREQRDRIEAQRGAAATLVENFPRLLEPSVNLRG